MMKIHLASDLHLEFAPLELPGGDILILAGDACEVIDYGVNENIQKFFEQEIPKYGRVLYVMGNHEHYNGNIDKTANYLRSNLPYNVTLMDNDAMMIDGVLFVGATLWTDCNKKDWATMWTVQKNMTDYHCIKKAREGKQGELRRLVPEDTMEEHHKTLEFFKNTFKNNPNTPTVVITHHAPTFMEIEERYQDQHLMNGAYCSDLSELILDNPQIKVWCHGHQHNHKDYMLGSTRILANPRGYIPYESAEMTGFDADFSFEV